MSVEFILGRSGTGKTRQCIKEICDCLCDRESDRPLVFLVPEQATYQAERAVLSDSRITGYHRLHIVSFNRLQRYLLGHACQTAELSRIGREMVVRKILRDHSDNVSFFSTGNSQGATASILQTLIELQEYEQTPDSLFQAAESFAQDPIMKKKLSELATLYQSYLTHVDKHYVNPDLQLSKACQRIHASTLFDGATVWVDGFSGFTRQQLNVLIEMIKAADSVKIALCLDPNQLDLNSPVPDPLSLFGPTETTYVNLFEVFKKCKIQCKPPMILNTVHRFAADSALGHLEKSLFTYDDIEKSANTSGIEIIKASTPRAEANYIAGRIQQLVREQGYHYKEIAVIGCDMQTYQHYLEAAFLDYQIPYFLDIRKSMMNHPVVELLNAVMNVIVQGFQTSDILACMKTDLLPISRDDCDMLENYCLAFGIDQRDWISETDWSFEDADAEGEYQQHINTVRQQIIQPFLKLKQQLDADTDEDYRIDIQAFIRAIFDFIETLDIRKQLIDLSSDQNDDVMQHQQFYDRLIGVLDEMAIIFQEDSMLLCDAAAILTHALSAMSFAVIPHTLDQVLVGTIERSRHPELKVVFLLGATQRHFPSPISRDCILSETDREHIQAAGIELSDTLQQRLCARQYLAYIAFTRPSELLIISCPVADHQGSPVAASSFLNDVMNLFSSLHFIQVSDQVKLLETICTEYELSDILCAGLNPRNKHQQARHAAEIVLNDSMMPLHSFLNSARMYDNKAVIKDTTCQIMYSGKSSVSTSRLSCFAKCPYQHFARYILGLKERLIFKFEPVDLGIFYHAVLDVVFTQLKEENLNWADVALSKLDLILSESIDSVLNKNMALSAFASHSEVNRFILESAGRTLRDFTRVLVELAQAGSFQQVASESWFDSDTDIRVAVQSTSLGKMYIKGKIDRIDTAEVDGKSVAIVYDYKKKPRLFSWRDFYYGFDVQLMTYLLAVKNSMHQGVGAFYLPIESTVAPVQWDEVDLANEKKIQKPSGFFNGQYHSLFDENQATGWNPYYTFYLKKDGDSYGHYNRSNSLKPEDFEHVLRFLSDLIRDLFNSMLKGDIAVAPYRISKESPCSHCAYQSVCRFDPHINSYRFLESISKQKCLEQLEQPYA